MQALEDQFPSYKPLTPQVPPRLARHHAATLPSAAPCVLSVLAPSQASPPRRHHTRKLPGFVPCSVSRGTSSAHGARPHHRSPHPPYPHKFAHHAMMPPPPQHLAMMPRPIRAHHQGLPSQVPLAMLQHKVRRRPAEGLRGSPGQRRRAAQGGKRHRSRKRSGGCPPDSFNTLLKRVQALEGTSVEGEFLRCFSRMSRFHCTDLEPQTPGRISQGTDHKPPHPKLHTPTPRPLTYRPRGVYFWERTFRLWTACSRHFLRGWRRAYPTTKV